MFGFDDALMAAFAEEASMAEGADAALQAQQAAEAANAANAAATANELSMANAAGLGAVGGAGAGAGAGITQAGMASDVLAGGAGAGQAGINAAQVGANQAAATAIPNSGFTGQLPQGFQPGQIDALTRSAGPGIQVADATGGLPQGITQAPPMPTGVPEGYQGNVARASMNYIDPVDALKPTVTPPPSSFFDGMESFGKFVDEYPKSAAAAAYLTAYHTGLLDPRNNLSGQGGYSGPLSGYRMSPGFQGRYANPADYQPNQKRFQSGGIADIGGNTANDLVSQSNPVDMDAGYSQVRGGVVSYALGGIAKAAESLSDGSSNAPQGNVNVLDNGGFAETIRRLQAEGRLASGGAISYAKGGDTARALDFYRQMYSPDADTSSTPSPARGPLAGGIGHDPGIYYDMDPDTRYQDALTAAQIRNAKVAKRANMQMPTGKRPTPMGSLNLRPPGAQAEQAQSSLDPENAAHGGIMQARSTLGGYAAGGNPRLLKGPGDGMSDNIPATIAGKQPARLADGEFVVPADVVSHLGNGSTEAGAKKLHEMMTNVRKARTGNPKQGKQINPNKFTPK